MEESWKPVVGFEATYRISDLGRAYSVRQQKILRPSTSNSGGYPQYIFTVKGERTAKYAHHLVLEAFDRPRPAGLEARHLDGDASNPALRDSDGEIRLIWGTSGENKLDEVRHGTHYEASRVRCENGHEWTEENTRIECWPDGSFRARRCRKCKRQEAARLREKRKDDTRRCKEPDCDEPYFGRDWCSKHYGRWYRSQKVKPES